MQTTLHLLLVMTTLPYNDAATALARQVIDARLAACAHVGSPVRSFYRWQGALEEAVEIPLHFKTTQARYAQLQACIQAAHPYAVPEIVAVPLIAGLPAYLNWIDEASSPTSLT